MSEPIINGIDVSECPIYDKKTGCYHTFNGECVKDSCAVYKWLLEYKRMQQELDIKEKMLDKFMIGSGEILEKLQKENEELKKLKCKFKEYCTCDIEKYRSALEEIKSIIKNRYTYSARLFYAKDFINMLDDINNLINEVLNDRN